MAVGFADTAWCIDEDLVDADTADRACRAVLEALEARIHRTRIDAFSCGPAVLPEHARRAQAALRALSENGMGINLDLHDHVQRTILSDFASWSVNVDLMDQSGRLLANFHDCGVDVVFEATAQELEAITSRLAELPIIRLNEANARDKANRRAHRWRSVMAVVRGD